MRREIDGAAAERRPATMVARHREHCARLPAVRTVQVLYVRTSVAVFDAVTEWVNELNAAAEASGDPRRWTKNDLVNAVIARRLRDRTPGEVP